MNFDKNCNLFKRQLLEWYEYIDGSPDGKIIKTNIHLLFFSLLISSMKEQVFKINKNRMCLFFANIRSFFFIIYLFRAWKGFLGK
jgi:hypothetical protein